LLKLDKKTHSTRLLTFSTTAILNHPMAAAYPPGGTFFDTVKKSFVDVPVDASKDNAISTTEFLEAAESLTTLFGRLNSCSNKGWG
jgi:hypothetical protein